MKNFHQEILRFKTAPKAFANITAKIQEVVSESGLQTGLCHLFVRHTSASLVIQENADPDVLKDFESYFSDLVSEKRPYRHNDEGPDDMPAHIRTALTHTSESIPFAQGRLLLGTWQAIYIWEHRAQGHAREVVVHLTGQ